MLDEGDECWMTEMSVGRGRRVLDEGDECWMTETSVG